MAFSEFTVRSGGSNLNSGSLDGTNEAATTPLVSYAAGSWNSGTGVFTPASGNPTSDGVQVGHWMSITADMVTDVTPFVARVTAVSTTTITTSTTAKHGNTPLTGTGFTGRVGGAWAGPSGTTTFPFSLVQNTGRNATQDYVRVNFKNDQIYSVTVAQAAANAGPIRYQGYTSTFGDGGRAVFQGLSSGASHAILSAAVVSISYEDLEVTRNGTTGNASAVSLTGAGCVAHRVVAHDVRGIGFTSNIITTRFSECEAYACNQSNTANLPGFLVANALRCISHDNIGSNAHGFLASITGATFSNCIADNNGGDGYRFTTASGVYSLLNCDAFTNDGDGIDIAAATTYIRIENCNLLKNAYGINNSTSAAIDGVIVNCGFGSGTQANASGQTNAMNRVNQINSYTYASNVVPWVNPSNGDFRPNTSTVGVLGAGVGSYFQTTPSYTGTISYPDRSAAQALPSSNTYSRGRVVNEGG